MAFFWRSGEAVTLPTARYPVALLASGADFSTAHAYGLFNRQRLPAYHRLDLGATRTKTRARGVSQWNFSVYNVYNSKNASYFFFKDTDGGQQLMGETVFPFLPSVSYAFRF